MLTVSNLLIYPIKSLAGIVVPEAVVSRRGFQHDRRLVLINEHNCFLTQRELPAMALLKPVLANNGLYIHHKKNTIDPLFVPEEPDGVVVTVTIWDDNCTAQLYGKDVNNWFSEVLGTNCRLALMPDTTHRAVDKRYAQHNEIVSFADGYPILIIGQASLDDLNNRLINPLGMDRFRPNIVFTGGEAFLEDRFHQFRINTIDFTAVKPCARCVMTTIDQDTLAISKEPLKTLATYRQKDNKILFGQNLLHKGEGQISVGNTIHVTNYKTQVI